MNITKRSIWDQTGFMVKALGRGVFEFSDLNPQVEFRRRLTRQERLQLAWYFLRQSIARDATIQPRAPGRRPREAS